jgi:ABC-type nitrate/sulfonate/bicarbonate transport system substrate-binding protein
VRLEARRAVTMRSIPPTFSCRPRGIGRALGFVALLVSVVLLALLGTTGAVQQVSVLLNWSPTVEHIPVFIAREIGYFRDEGLDVRIKEGVGGADTAKVVGSGAENIGISAGTVLPIAREKGIPVVAIAVYYQKDPHAVISLKKTGVTKPKDMEGKRVGVKFGATSHYFYNAITDRYKVDRSKIEEVSIGKDVVQLLVSGRVDVVMGYISDEAVHAERLGGPLNLMLVHDLGLPLYGNLYVTSEQYAKENPKTVGAFLRAALKAWDFMLRDQEKAIDIFIKANPVLEGRKDILRAQLRKSLELLVSNDSLEAGLGVQTRRGWDDAQETLLKIGLIKNKVDSRSLYTTEFWEKVPKVDVKRIQTSN